MKTIKKTSRPFFVFNNPIHQILLNNLKFYILICLIILATALVFTSCSEDKEESYDDVPKELQDTAWGTPIVLRFSVTSWTRTNKDDDSYFTVSELKVKKIDNNDPETKDKAPSGYEISGKIISSTASADPKGKNVIYQFYLSTDTDNKEIYWRAVTK